MQEGLSWNDKGELIHVINGELRAVVQAEHADEYCEQVGLTAPRNPDRRF